MSERTVCRWFGHRWSTWNSRVAVGLFGLTQHMQERDCDRCGKHERRP